MHVQVSRRSSSDLSVAVGEVDWMFFERATSFIYGARRHRANAQALITWLCVFLYNSSRRITKSRRRRLCALRCIAWVRESSERGFESVVGWFFWEHVWWCDVCVCVNRKLMWPPHITFDYPFVRLTKMFTGTATIYSHTKHEHMHILTYSHTGSELWLKHVLHYIRLRKPALFWAVACIYGLDNI